MKKYKYIFKYINNKNGHVNSEYLHMGEENYIFRALQNGSGIMDIFQSLYFEVNAYRVKLMRRDLISDRIETIIDSKANKLLIEIDDIKQNI